MINKACIFELRQTLLTPSEKLSYLSAIRSFSGTSIVLCCLAFIFTNLGSGIGSTEISGLLVLSALVFTTSWSLDKILYRQWGKSVINALDDEQYSEVVQTVTNLRDKVNEGDPLQRKLNKTLVKLNSTNLQSKVEGLAYVISKDRGMLSVDIDVYNLRSEKRPVQ